MDRGLMFSSSYTLMKTHNTHTHNGGRFVYFPFWVKKLTITIHGYIGVNSLFVIFL